MDIFASRSAEPMLIGMEGEPFDSSEYLFELKMDGERCLAYLDSGETTLINRRGRLITANFPELAVLHEQTKSRCILDGEIIVGVGDKANFEDVKRRALTKNPYTIKRLSKEIPTTFVALDILYLGKRAITDLPLSSRKDMLSSTVMEKDRLAIVRSVDRNGVRFYNTVRDQGLEGVVGKQKESVYRMGKRTKDWIKIKNWMDDDFVICGYLVGDATRATVASIILGQYNRARKMVYKGRVTLGLNRDEFHRIASQPTVKTHPFTETPPEESKGARWIRPNLVCTVGFMCWTSALRLRQPFFKGLSGKKADTVTEYIPATKKAISCV